jgi:hypothetical protein
MLQKLLNENGQKAHQRDDNEDRSLPYRNWLRTVETDGYWIDVDFIKWKFVDGKPTPYAVTDLTRSDKDTCEEHYRWAISDRIFRRDRQGLLLKTVGELLHIPVYLVLFQKDMKWIWALDINTREWKEYTTDDWAAFLKTL